MFSHEDTRRYTKKKRKYVGTGHRPVRFNPGSKGGGFGIAALPLHQKLLNRIVGAGSKPAPKLAGYPVLVSWCLGGKNSHKKLL